MRAAHPDVDWVGKHQPKSDALVAWRDRPESTSEDVGTGTNHVHREQGGSLVVAHDRSDDFGGSCDN